MSRDFSFIATHQPLNVTAQNILSKGIHYNSDINNPHHFDTPQPINKKGNIASKLKYFIGKKIGRFTLMGECEEEICGERRWLVRCVCGQYESKTAIYLLKKIEYAEDVMCLECLDLKNLKFRHDYFLKYGTYPDDLILETEKLFPQTWSICELPKEFQEFIGKKFGHFTIVNITPDVWREILFNYKNITVNTATWVVKCRCGEILTRKGHQLIKNKDYVRYYCKKCDERSDGLRRKFFEINNRWPTDKETSDLVYPETQ